MAKTLDDALDQLATLIGQIDGIRIATSMPTGRSAQWPIAICTPGTGSWNTESSGLVKELHTLSVQVHVPWKDLPRAITKIRPLGKLIKDKILGNLTLNSTVDTVNEIRYTFGLLGLAHLDTIGWDIEVDVKIKSTL